MTEGTAYLTRQLDRLGDDDLTVSSRLPGWNRAHVLAHVARNADALVNLLYWARTGVETPMYESREQRNADIEAGARQSQSSLRADVRSSGDRLAEAGAELPEHAWATQVRTAGGREIPASEVPWMRVREVWIHSIDLDAGACVADFPAPLVDALLTDVTGSFAQRAQPVPVRLAPTDRDQPWAVRGEDADEVTGVAADLLAWLIGRDAGESLRTTRSEGRLPDLPAWL